MKKIILNYNRRIMRPRFWELNPFRYYLHSNNYVIGNPFLQPSFTQKIELKHNWQQKIFTSIFIRFTEDGYNKVPYVDTNKKSQVFKTENFYDEYSLGLSESYIFGPLPWWESSNKVNISYIKTVVNKRYKDKLTAPKSIWNSKLSTSNSFILNSQKTFYGELNFDYAFPSQYGAFNLEAYYSLNIALKAYFLQRKLTVALVLNDIFKTKNANAIIYTKGIKQMYNDYNDSRYFKLTLRYSFGNNKIKVKQRKFGNEEESQRININ